MSWSAGLRVAVFVLGAAAVASAIVLWLVPTSDTSTTVKTQTTTVVTDHAGAKTRTEVAGTTTTTAPGLDRSDTVLVALLTFGAGLLLAAGLWDRIQELAVAGVSVKLAVVGPEGIALVDAVAARVDSVDNSSAENIVREVQAVATAELGLVRVDLADGRLWAPTNLCWFVLLLASRTVAEVIVFTIGGTRYVGSASVTRFARWIDLHESAVATAHQETEAMPLDAGMPNETVGQKFFETWRQLAPAAAVASTERVDAQRLKQLAGPTLVTASVEWRETAALSRTMQRALLTFPLEYVPLTQAGNLVEIVDRQRLAQRVALQAAGV